MATTLLVAVPLAYAAILLVHPVPEDGPILHGLGHSLHTWNLVHVAQLGFVGAIGGALTHLVHGLGGHAATVARGSALVFVLVYGAYEAWTGITTGALGSAASELSAADQKAASVLIQAH